MTKKPEKTGEVKLAGEGREYVEVDDDGGRRGRGEADGQLSPLSAQPSVAAPAATAAVPHLSDAVVQHRKLEQRPQMYCIILKRKI
jgi:hypothetical protein